MNPYLNGVLDHVPVGWKIQNEQFTAVRVRYLLQFLDLDRAIATISVQYSNYYL
jgi:hypothetical protein